MAKQTINIGSGPNKNDGDPLRTSFQKINQNFDELYALSVGPSSALQELAQDYAAAMFLHGNHTNIGIIYDDANNQLLLSSAIQNVSQLSNDVGYITDADVGFTVIANDSTSLEVDNNGLLTIYGEGGTTVNVNPAGGLEITSHDIINDLSDVDILSPATGDFLTYNGTTGKWVNAALLNNIVAGSNISLLTNDEGYLTSVTGTVTGSLVPDTDVTYDLGSATNRFRDIYLSGSTIDLGGTTLSVVSGELQLGGAKVPTQAEITSQIATAVSAPTGDLTGSVFADDSTLLVDGVAGKIVGNVETSLLRTSEDYIRLGQNAGALNQGRYAVAIGNHAGNTNQDRDSIAIGSFAGYTDQQGDGVAIGMQAGYENQQGSSIAIGPSAGESNQGNSAVAIGSVAGQNNQTQLAVAVGNYAGNTNQGEGAVAIGSLAGAINQGKYSIAIGWAGEYSCPENTIILNASEPGNIRRLDVAAGNYGFYVNPVRDNTTGNFLQYNTSTKEITYTNSIGSVTGDLTGSVFADDSTLLVDGVNGRIVGPLEVASNSNITFKNNIDPVTWNDGSIVADGYAYRLNFPTNQPEKTAPLQIAWNDQPYIQPYLPTSIGAQEATSGKFARSLGLIGGDATETRLPGNVYIDGGRNTSAGTYGDVVIAQSTSGNVYIGQDPNLGNFHDGNIYVGGTSSTINLAGTIDFQNNTVQNLLLSTITSGLTAPGSAVVAGETDIRFNFSGSPTALTVEANAITIGSNITVNGFVGDITGDVTGSVFADDSTILVDGVAGKIVGNVNTSAIETTVIVAQGGNFNTTGGNLTIGAANGTATGGYVLVAGGLGTAGTGGPINLSGGNGSAGDGGNAILTGGAGTGGNGGSVSLLGGSGSVNGGDVYIYAGSGSSGTDGSVQFSGQVNFTNATVTGLPGETTTTLTADSVNQKLVFTDETGTANNIDLSWAVDDTNLARLTSGSLDGLTGVATFTRDDATTFTVDFSALLNITLADLSVGADAAASSGGGLAYNNSTGVFTYTPPDLSSYIDLTDLSVSAPAAASGSGAIAYNPLTGVFTYTPPDILNSFNVVSNPASGNGTLTYTNSTGTFTYTPPDLSSYLTSEANDLTTAVTWANVPDANITQSSVIQHEAALSINESQINFTSSFIELFDLSVTQLTASGNGSLSYNNSTGVFTYTPPDLSSYLTSEVNDLTASVTWANVPDANITQSSVTQHQSAITISESQITDLGNYATLSDISLTINPATIGGTGSLSYNNTTGVFTFEPADVEGGIDAHLNTSTATAGQILSWTGTDYDWVADASGIALTDLSVTQNAASGSGALSYNNTTGVFSYTPPDLSGYLTSYTETDTLDDVTGRGATTTNSITVGGLTTNGVLQVEQGTQEAFATLTNATGTVTHDCSNGHIFYHTTPSADWTANFTNLTLTAEYATALTIVITQGATAYIPTAVQIGGAAQTIIWQGGSAPSGTASGTDVVSFSILNDGGTYIVLGNLSSFGGA